MSNLITGLFDTHAAAENAVAQLKALGYTPNEISIIAKDTNDAHEVSEATHGGAQEGHPTARVGGTVGALLGGLLAVGVVALPGVGLIAAGAVAALFVGGGALTGSAVGWFVDQGIPEDAAPYFERGLHEGGIVVAVAAHENDAQKVYALLHGGASAYAGANVATYISPALAARHADLTLPAANNASVPSLGSPPEIDRGQADHVNP